jgi:hypothetical protein
MILLLRMLITGIALFFFTNMFLEDISNRNNGIVYKLYIFTFVFLLQIILNVFNTLFNGDKITLNHIMDTAVNNALLAVIAYDVYGDLKYQNLITASGKYQQSTVLVLLIISFITTVKILQLLLTQ